MNSTVELIYEYKLIAIIRGVAAEQMKDVFQALYDGGIRMAEITLNTDRALYSISQMRELYGDRMCIGAGSVLDQAMAKQAVEAGAQFLIAPNVAKEMIHYALSESILPLPGALTPTEIVDAVRYGAPLVKVFPCSGFGTRYLQDLQGPLGHIPMLAVGGIDADNAADYIRAGAVGVGVGGHLINRTWIAERRFADISAYARTLIERINLA